MYHAIVSPTSFNCGLLPGYLTQLQLYMHGLEAAAQLADACIQYSVLVAAFVG